MFIALLHVDIIFRSGGEAFRPEVFLSHGTKDDRAAAPEPTLSARGWAYLKFVGEIVYGENFRSALQSAVRFQHNLDEFLTNKDVASAWATVNCRVPEPPPTSPKHFDNDAKSDCLAIARQAAAELLERSDCQQELDWAALGFTAETQPTLLQAAEAAQRLVEDHITFIDSDQSLTSLIPAFQASPSVQKQGSIEDGNVVVVYDVKVS